MRPIDADKVLGVLRELDAHSFSGTMHIKNAMYLINEQPTVYDVDKVVEQLRKDKFIDCETVLSDVHQGYNAGLSRAIDIVKAGVDTEINHGKEVYLKALEDYHRLISEECESMLIDFNPYAFHLKKYNDEVLERLKAGGKND